MLTRAVLPLRALRTSVHRNQPLDHLCHPHLACSLPPALLQQPSAAVHSTHDLPGPRTQSATPSCLLVRCVGELQRAHARHHQPFLAYHRFWHRSCFVDGRGILVLLVHSRRPWRSRWWPSQRWQGLYFGRSELLGTLAFARLEMSCAEDWGRLGNLRRQITHGRRSVRALLRYDFSIFSARPVGRAA